MDELFLFITGYICLDFINTQQIKRGQQVDLLPDFPLLVQWLHEAEVLDESQVVEVTQRWGGAEASQQVLEEAHRLRHLLRTICEDVVQNKLVSPNKLDNLNAYLKNGKRTRRVVPTEQGYTLKADLTLDTPESLLLPIAESASSLLCHSDLSLVKKCHNPACILFFYDTTKNHARRWCNMATCGNRIKAATHYERKRQ